MFYRFVLKLFATAISSAVIIYIIFNAHQTRPSCVATSTNGKALTMLTFFQGPAECP